MAVHVCKCGHHGWQHGGGFGPCRQETVKTHPTDKKIPPRRTECRCDQFKKGKTLAEHQAEQAA